MNKPEFLAQLRQGLSLLPREDIEERLTFYSEMIDDRMEEGLSEEAAVCAIGNADEIISQILADTPPTKCINEKIPPKRRLKAWEIVLLALGSPIWLSLLIAALAVILSLYVVLWSVIISLWAVFGSLICCAFGGIAAAIILACSGTVPSGVALLGAGILCAGLSIFMFCGCRAATKGTLLLTKKLAQGLKNSFAKRRNCNA